MIRRIRSAARTFARDDAGTYTIEALLVIPLLVWAFLAMHVFSDAYHKRLLVTKAGHTIADLLSRQDADPVSNDFLDGLEELFAELTLNRVEADLRMSVVSFDADEDKFLLDWSYRPGGCAGRVDQDYLDDSLADGIPITAAGARVIIVEVWASYGSASSFGLPKRLEMTDVLHISSRGPQLRFDDSCAGIS